MIKLFEANETNFKGCRWILSEITKCEITEDLEGHFEIDLEYPLFDKKGLSKNLINGNIISCPVDERVDQLFRIRKVTRNTNSKRVNVYGECIARADLDTNYTCGVHIENCNRKEAVKKLLDSRVQKKRNYQVGNLDTNTNKNINLGIDEATGNIINYLDIADVSPLSGLLDDNLSIQKAYGGEIIWNNFTIDMVDERGSDHTFTIKSGKNLQELEQDISDMEDDFATALIMESSDGLFLPNHEIIYSKDANKYNRYYFKSIKCDDISLVNDSHEAINIVYEQLRERASKLFTDGIDKPKINNKINFMQLSNTEEYKDFKVLEKCELGNKVKVLYPKIGIELEQRVIKIKRNALKNKIIEVELGEKKKSIVDNINNTENKVDNVNNKVDKNKTDLKQTKVTMEKYNNSIVLKVENLSKDTMAKIELLEKEITAKVSEDNMWSLIEMNPSKILFAVNDKKNETDVTITTDGLSVYKGKIQIYDKNDNLVFKIREKGGINSRLPYKIMESDMDTTAASFSDRGINWHSTSTAIKTSSKGVYIDTNNKNLYIDDEKLEDVIRAVLKNEGLI
ncbi:phage tail protein [Clostridium botulinum]|uniref:phage tail protein n=2 Tax=Clostridium botulinum TaxID=1491 RepID=UPI001C9B0819|nr:phage tail protein [Clostridium botulinum]MBY6816474.1 phage tail protein [Clostridium botulinum]MBY6827271.1 phage tail protein [Clostridium botulinum]MBY6859219.1 phage tail protein [Clostridium botulinum]MBY7041497.1 phage tail protein [Clostridium botulinum]